MNHNLVKQDVCVNTIVFAMKLQKITSNRLKVIR